MLFLWVTTKDNPIGRASLELLLLLLKDPSFRPEDIHTTDAQHWLSSTDNCLPVPAVTKTLVAHKVTVGKNQTIVKDKEAYNLGVIPQLRQFMATHTLREKLLLHYDDTRGAPVTEFNQTPLFKEPFRWTKLISFWHKGVEYTQYDFCVLNETRTMRIDSMHYARQTEATRTKIENGELGQYLPKLHVRGPLLKTNNFGDMVLDHDTQVESPASAITSRVTVGDGSTFDIDATSLSARANDEDGPYTTAIPELGPAKEVVVGNTTHNPVVIWLALYIDKFGTTKRGNQSTEGVYMAILNVKSDVFACPETIFTIKLLGPGCFLAPALASINEECQRLASTGVVMFDSSTGSFETVRAGVLMFPADHVQALTACRGLGNSALMNGRGCALPLDKFSSSTVDCRDHTLMRREQQTDVTVSHLRDLIANESLLKTAAKSIRKWFGTKVTPSPFGDAGMARCSHKMSMVDASHLLWFGVFKSAYVAVVENMTGAQQVDLSTRLRDFPWPAGISPPTKLAKQLTSGKDKVVGAGITMDGMRYIGAASTLALEGLVGEREHKLVVDIVKFAALAFSPVAVDGLADIEERARSIIRRGCGPSGLLSACPNTHLLLELATHTLPAVRNAKFVDTRHFEKHHGGHTFPGSGANAGGGGNYAQLNAMRWYARRVSMRNALHGMVWSSPGGNGMHQLHESLARMRDYRPGREQNPHPLLVAVTRSAVPSAPCDGSAWVGTGGWMPWKLSPSKSQQQFDEDCKHNLPASAVAASASFLVTGQWEAQRDDTLSTDVVPFDWAGCKLHHCKEVHKQDGPRTKVVRVGDDVRVNYRGADGAQVPAWMTIRRITVVVQALHTTIWVWPKWWFGTGRQRSNGEEREYCKHSWRGTTLVQRIGLDLEEDSGVSTPVPIACVDFQVCIVHSCVRAGLVQPGAHANACSVGTYCRAHQEILDSQGACVSGCTSAMESAYTQDKHNLERNPVYEVLDRAVGFTGATIRTPLQFDLRR
jgi:hypothetical protein